MVNRKKLLSLHAALIKRGVDYGFGAKAEGGSDPRNGRRWNRDSTHHLSTPVSTIENLDCSGLIRYEAFQASGGDLVLPDGSQAQLDWCRKNWKQVGYGFCENRDNVLRIAFMTPGVHGVGSIGHVWWIFNGNTLESYGGHGVGSHKWSVYASRVSACFEVPSISGVDAVAPVAAPAPAATPPEGPKHDPAILVLNVTDMPVTDTPVENAYLAGGHWLAPDGSLAQILGYTTQTPALIVPVLQAAMMHGYALDAYTQQLNERGRADMRLARVA